MASKKMYVGKIHNSNTLEYFRSENTPVRSTHGGRYVYTVGPFRTKAGAIYYQQFGLGNPHTQTVADCERLAKHYKEKYVGGRFIN